jgi:hypothetical protein
MRHAILRELAVQSLQVEPDLETQLGPDLMRAAAVERITLEEWFRERLLLKAGVASLGALLTLAERRVAVEAHAKTHVPTSRRPRKISRAAA